MADSRTQTVKAGLLKMQGRKDFYLRVASELGVERILTRQPVGNGVSHVADGPAYDGLRSAVVEFITAQPGAPR